MATAPECGWPGCDHPARLTVSSGPLFERAVPHGWFCVPHAAIASRQVRDQHHEPVWFDWARPRTLHVVGDQATKEPAANLPGGAAP